MASMPNRKALLDQLGGSEDDENTMNTGYNGGSIALDPAGAAPIGSGDMESTIAGEPRVTGAPGAELGVNIVEDTAPSGAAPPASDYGRLMGYDAGKLNDPNKHDFKYDTARVLSRFDPRQGFTPDVINALNSELGNTYGTFSGSGDKLSLTGAKGAKDAADFANQDWIFAHKANSDATKWNFGGGGAAPQETGSAGGSASGGMRSPGLGGLAGGPALDEALTGDPLARIQQLIAQLSGSRPNFAALMQQLGGQ